MAEIQVRALRAGDGAGSARAWLDATVDGQVAGFVLAVLEAPLPDAHWQLARCW
jgi:hypothetical protein